jgi:hypothetical protein
VVSGDWFNANVSLAPLYYQTLKLPTRLSDLEDILAVNRRENILNLRVARAGFNNSGVSRNNRVIERHATANGAFWMSYDFSDSLGDRNIFSFPLGPFGSLASFKPSGGEMIFNFPNGLQAYYVTDANGRRVDRAPTEIVSDPKRADRAVTSAVSCFSCHGTTGINFKDDQMHSFLASNPQAFDREVRGGIASLYTEPKLMRKWMLEDSRRYIDALSKALATPYGPEQEPITQANQEFESNVTLGGGAAELGLKPVDLAARIKASKRLGELLGGWLVPGGSIARESFLEALPEVLKNLD